jgi:hypothetical protein
MNEYFIRASDLICYMFRLIEDLQSLGINVSDIKKLQDAGLHTIGGR